MNNTQLNINVNPDLLLNTLANNIGVDFISDGSNLKKMTDGYSNEHVTFKGIVNDAQSNLFVSSADARFLDLIGQQNGLFRKRYRSVSFTSSDLVAVLEIPTGTAISPADTNITPFRRGDTITINTQFVIQFAQDVTLSDIYNKMYVSAKITSFTLDDTFVIPKDSEYSVQPTQKLALTTSNVYKITFKKSLGISVVEEDINDFRSRIYQSAFLANNGANSLLSVLVKEVPLVKFIQSDSIDLGRSVKSIYVFTDELIDSGYDETINISLIPLMTTNLEERAIQGSLVDIQPAEPLRVSLYLDSTKLKLKPIQGVLTNAALSFNRTFATRQGQILLSEIINYLVGNLSKYNITADMFSVKVVSTYVSEETLTLDLTDTNPDTAPILLPLGRFIRVDSLSLITPSSS